MTFESFDHSLQYLHVPPTPIQEKHPRMLRFLLHEWIIRISSKFMKIKLEKYAFYFI